jgi:co-chaperonin GroES (HSP10)
MRITPNRGRVFVKLLPIEERVLKSGLIIPGKHAEPSRIGDVLAVASDVTNFKAGDRVFINWFSGTGCEYPGLDYNYDTHRFFAEVEILAKVEDWEG